MAEGEGRYGRLWMGIGKGKRDGMSLREAGAARVKCQSEEGASKALLGALGRQDRSGLTQDTVLCSAIHCKQVPDYNT